ncbi:MAG: hypothetical protein LC118_03080 [Dehalococcoidia bacterium]|nr:hypothetical protein [Dehalococcoidia bacterium]
MKVPGVRSVVTYALVGATIYAMVAGIAPESSRDVVTFAGLALGFFFKGTSDSVGR